MLYLEFYGARDTKSHSTFPLWLLLASVLFTVVYFQDTVMGRVIG